MAALLDLKVYNFVPKHSLFNEISVTGRVHNGEVNSLQFTELASIAFREDKYNNVKGSILCPLALFSHAGLHTDKRFVDNIAN